MRTIIETENLIKTFQNGKETSMILKQLNFSVKEGEFVSIMGPSGCGKSTLLYLLGGLDLPTSGSVKFNGEDLGKMKAKELSKLRRRELGFVFQFYNLVPNLTVEENILLPILLDGHKTKHTRNSWKRCWRSLECPRGQNTHQENFPEGSSKEWQLPGRCCIIRS